jgi:hypothetical protein
VPVVIGGDNLPSPVGIGLTDLPNIGGASGPPGPPSSGITVGNHKSEFVFFNYGTFTQNMLQENEYYNLRLKIKDKN